MVCNSQPRKPHPSRSIHQFFCIGQAIQSAHFGMGVQLRTMEWKIAVSSILKRHIRDLVGPYNLLPSICIQPYDPTYKYFFFLGKHLNSMRRCLIFHGSQNVNRSIVIGQQKGYDAFILGALFSCLNGESDPLQIYSAQF